MRLGIAYPNIGEWVDPVFAGKVAVEAEKLGYEVFMTYDHYMLPGSNKTFEAWIFLTYIASITGRIKVGTVVTPIPFRPPAMLAKMVATLDYISGGRVIVGVGAGWHQPEFEAFSKWSPLKERVDRTLEGIKLMIDLWTRDVVDFKGKFYVAKGAVVDPKPIQKPYPPLWFGTTGKRMLRLTAKYGDGWIPVGINVEEYSKYRDYIEEYRRKYSTIGKKFTYSIMFRGKADPNEDIDRVKEFKKAGLQLLVLDLHPIGIKNALAYIRKAVEVF
ncbi:MAG TPA: LLM class flavin-dependent oxidoreductase, partial [Thermoproteales archaeon]|nr:LLM class flavin-dependent oxidoreductase [Thermoproteales archaeon]